MTPRVYKPGDLVEFLLHGEWVMGVVDYVYQTGGDIVISVEPYGVFERNYTEVRPVAQ